ncbi:Gfo/Idh/MocA family oxidoreductase [Georgenia sp. TF02-10]|uniref:Gfo/Idh/MocA family protein n=1 Tax=Georgenia sp. TF02-10 TaxID=2917725 RepID=UPI001FA715A2|nr:Gfo/Idh/MocA family oxidoreductase [Georgenia sp. TF02-10]UNX54936.1 Gfo/Idh/MocA family oxidoreductase [Georgenia sp. TF02-10]
MSIRTAVIGYGTGGRHFHAPFLAADSAFHLDTIVTADARRAEAARADHPGTDVVADLDTLLERAGDLDLAIVATPPARHAEQAHAALDAGLHVVVEKPLSLTGKEGSELLDHAAEAGRVLTVFQNRRWDGDFRTVRRLIEEGRLGHVRRFESRFEWWKPEEPKVWKAAAQASEGGGILFDLGPHLLDQALQLFGPVEDAHAELVRYRSGDGADDDAFVALRHTCGVTSHLWMNGLAPQLGPRFRVLGSQAGFTTYGLDPQEPALKAGASPTDPGFGERPREQWGVLGRTGEEQPVPTDPGDYAAFYRGLAATLREGDPPPVDAHDSLAVIELIQALHQQFPLRRAD